MLPQASLPAPLSPASGHIMPAKSLSLLCSLSSPPRLNWQWQLGLGRHPSSLAPGRLNGHCPCPRNPDEAPRFPGCPLRRKGTRTLECFCGNNSGLSVATRHPPQLNPVALPGFWLTQKHNLCSEPEGYGGLSWRNIYLEVLFGSPPPFFASAQVGGGRKGGRESRLSECRCHFQLTHRRDVPGAPASCCPF